MQYLYSVSYVCSTSLALGSTVVQSMLVPQVRLLLRAHRLTVSFNSSCIVCMCIQCYSYSLFKQFSILLCMCHTCYTFYNNLQYGVIYLSTVSGHCSSPVSAFFLFVSVFPGQVLPPATFFFFIKILLQPGFSRSCACAGCACTHPVGDNKYFLKYNIYICSMLFFFQQHQTHLTQDEYLYV